jgi:hypothetical protein
VSPFSVRPSHWVLAALDGRGAPLEQPPDEVLAFLKPEASRLARRADARDAPLWALFRTDLLRGSWLVIWRDIAPRLEAAPLCRRAADSPIPLNTCYGVAVADAYTACWLAAYLNSAAARNLAAALAERASGGAYRFSARTVGALPLPPDPQAPMVQALADIGASAMKGESWDAHDLDARVTLALGLAPHVSSQLTYLGDALRRDAGGDR